MTTSVRELNDRAAAVLRAVAANRARITLSREPDLSVDGLLCCDQSTARDLAHAGLIRPARPGLPGAWVPATLTTDGWRMVAAATSDKPAA